MTRQALLTAERRETTRRPWLVLLVAMAAGALLAIGVALLLATFWARRAARRLDDAAPGGHRVHSLLDWERAAIVALCPGEAGSPAAAAAAVHAALTGR